MDLFEKCHIPVCCFLETLKRSLTYSFDFPYIQLQKSDFDTLYFEIKFQKINGLKINLINYPHPYLNHLKYEYLHRTQGKEHEFLHQDVDLFHFQPKGELPFVGNFPEYLDKYPLTVLLKDENNLHKSL